MTFTITYIGSVDPKRWPVSLVENRPEIWGQWDPSAIHWIRSINDDLSISAWVDWIVDQIPISTGVVAVEDLDPTRRFPLFESITSWGLHFRPYGEEFRLLWIRNGSFVDVGEMKRLRIRELQHLTEDLVGEGNYW